MTTPQYSLVPWTRAGTVSTSPIKLNGNQLVGFILPATIVSTSFTFNMAITSNIGGAATNIAWIPVADSTGTTLSFTTTAATAKYYGFSQDQIAKFTGAEILQFVAGSSEAANQLIYAILIPRPSI